jgi:hypothetical protein
MTAARTAPVSGPIQNTQWFFHTLATAEAPKERAGLMLQLATCAISTQPTRWIARNTEGQIFGEERTAPAAIQGDGHHVAQEHVHANREGRQHLHAVHTSSVPK